MTLTGPGDKVPLSLISFEILPQYRTLLKNNTELNAGLDIKQSLQHGFQNQNLPELKKGLVEAEEDAGG